MARSQLLKDIVSGKENMESILLRLKVILSDLDSEPIIEWVNGELEGYKGNTDILPEYRVIKGTPIGTYLVNYNVKYTNAQVPLSLLIKDDEVYDNVITLHVTEGFSAIQNMLSKEDSGNISKMIDTGFCHAISTQELQITGMNIRFGSNQFDDIVSKVKSKLIDIVIELEKQFIDLDELDIGNQVAENKSKRNKVVVNIQNIIYDESVKIGDNNKVSKSRLGHLFGENKE